MSDDDKKTVYQSLRLFDDEQLNTILRRHEWINEGLKINLFRKDRDTKAEKIRDRAETKLIEADDPIEGNGDPDWRDFRRHIVDDIVWGGFGKDDRRIERTLKNTEIRPLNRESGEDDDAHRAKKEEQWYSAQLYGALYNEFDTRDTSQGGLRPTTYSVYREHDKWGLNVDLFVKNDDTGEFYLIEIKRAEMLSGLKEVKNQIKRYEAVFSENQETFLSILYADVSQLTDILPEPHNGNGGESKHNAQISVDKAQEAIEDTITNEIKNVTVVVSAIDPDP